MAAGLDLGQEEDPSAICRLGRGLDGFSALVEAGAGDSVEAFEDGCGPIHGTGIEAICLTAGGVTGTHGVYTHIAQQHTRTGIPQRRTWDTGEGVN